MDQALNSQKTPHTSPLRASYGMSFVSILMKNDRVIKGFYCITKKLSSLYIEVVPVNPKSMKVKLALSPLSEISRGALSAKEKRRLLSLSETVFKQWTRNMILNTLYSVAEPGLWKWQNVWDENVIKVTFLRQCAPCKDRKLIQFHLSKCVVSIMCSLLAFQRRSSFSIACCFRGQHRYELVLNDLIDSKRIYVLVPYPLLMAWTIWCLHVQHTGNGITV